MRLPEPASRALRALKHTQIPVYAGNAAFFLVLSFLPLLTRFWGSSNTRSSGLRTCSRSSRASCRTRFCRCSMIFCRSFTRKAARR